MCAVRKRDGEPLTACVGLQRRLVKQLACRGGVMGILANLGRVGPRDQVADRSGCRHPLAEVHAFHEKLPIDRVRDGATDANVREGRPCQVRNQDVLTRRSAGAPGTLDHGDAGRALQPRNVGARHAERVVHFSTLQRGDRRCRVRQDPEHESVDARRALAEVRGIAFQDDAIRRRITDEAERTGANGAAGRCTVQQVMP